MKKSKSLLLSVVAMAALSYPATASAWDWWNPFSWNWCSVGCGIGTGFQYGSCVLGDGKDAALCVTTLNFDCASTEWSGFMDCWSDATDSYDTCYEDNCE